MPSPFPGMDPYLEGYLWPDVYHRLATEIARRLGVQIRPRYVTRLEITVVEDVCPVVELGPLLQTIYDEAGYDLSIDYTQPPPPELSADEIAWMQTIHRTANS